MTKTIDRYSAKETQRRFEASLRAALNTPPKRMKDIPRKRPKVQRVSAPKKP